MIARVGPMRDGHVIGFDGQHVDREQFLWRGGRIPVGVIGERIVGSSNIGDVTEGGIVDHQFVVETGRGDRMQNDLHGLALSRRRGDVMIGFVRNVPIRQ